MGTHETLLRECGSKGSRPWWRRWRGVCACSLSPLEFEMLLKSAKQFAESASYTCAGFSLFCVITLFLHLTPILSLSLQAFLIWFLPEQIKTSNLSIFASPALNSLHVLFLLSDPFCHSVPWGDFMSLLLSTIIFSVVSPGPFNDKLTRPVKKKNWPWNTCSPHILCFCYLCIALCLCMI